MSEPTATLQRVPLKIIDPVKADSKLRMALEGISKSGKSYTMLFILCAMAKLLGEKVLCIDTERGSLSKYADIPDFCDADGKPVFKVIELPSFAPDYYIDAIDLAEAQGFGLLGVDSLSPAWAGKDGILEMVDGAARASGKGDKFAGWRDATPLHNRLVDRLLTCNAHLLVTLRQKDDIVMEKDPESGKTKPKKVGTKAIQRDGMEYEFDIYGTMDDATMTTGNTRCPSLNHIQIAKPGADVAASLVAWLKARSPEEQSASLKNRLLTGAERSAIIGEMTKRGLKIGEQMKFLADNLGRTDLNANITVADREKLFAALQAGA